MPEKNSPENLFGVGLRHQHFPHLEKKPKTNIGWFEVISENFMYTKGRPLHMLDLIREDYPVALHGVSMSLASFEEIDFGYLQKLKELIKRVDPFIVSDHLCWTGKKSSNVHNLLPIAYTEENLKFLTQKIRTVQDYLERQISIENLSAYFSLRSSTFTEWNFLHELGRASGCKILLDINNIYVNSRNQKFDAKLFLDEIPADCISHFHLAGHTDLGTHLFDTHSRPVCQDVWDLYKYKLKDCRHVPTLIEWDEDIPDFELLEAEALKAMALSMLPESVQGTSP